MLVFLDVSSFQAARLLCNKLEAEIGSEIRGLHDSIQLLLNFIILLSFKTASQLH